MFKMKQKLEKTKKLFNKLEKKEDKPYPKKKQPIFQQAKFKPPNWPKCRNKKWLEVDNGWYCQNCEINNNKKKHQIDCKFLHKIIVFQLD